MYDDFIDSLHSEETKTPNSLFDISLEEVVVPNALKTHPVTENFISATTSDKFSYKIYLLTWFNAVKTSVPVPIALSLLAALQGQKLDFALTEISVSLLFSSILGSWMEWYKIKYRLTPEFYVMLWNPNITDYKESALYLAYENGKRSYLTLHKENLEIKSLTLLDQTIFKSIINNIQHKKDLTVDQSNQLRAHIACEHTPALKPDIFYVPGKKLDKYFFWKCVSSKILSSMTAGCLLGLALGEKLSFEMRIAFSVILSISNLIKTLIIDAIIIFNAYVESCPRSCPGDKLAGLAQQPMIKYFYNRFFLMLLRDLSAAILSLLSLSGLYQLLKMNVHVALAIIVCTFLYPFITSSFRIFILDAAEKQLNCAGISFSMENSLYDSKHTVIQLIGELLSCRYLTVDMWLQCHTSPITITYALVIGAIIGSCMLLWIPFNDDIFCPAKDCFGQGQGALISFVIPSENLDAAGESKPYLFPTFFSVLIIIIIISTTYSAFGSFSNIYDYIDHRDKAMKCLEAMADEHYHLFDDFPENDLNEKKIVLVSRAPYSNSPWHARFFASKVSTRNISNVCLSDIKNTATAPSNSNDELWNISLNENSNNYNLL